MNTVRSRFLALIAALCALLLVATGCSAIPTSGPIGTIAPTQATGQDDGFSFEAIGPQPGQSPEDVVQGFLTAGADSQDAYSTAREFLTPDLAKKWDANAATTVRNSEPRIAASDADTGKYRAEMRVTTRIDADGIRTDPQKPERAELAFELTQVGGQWRISKAPDGIVLDAGLFGQIFQPHTLYFPDLTGTYAVPDIRWFANRQGRNATLVNALMRGPAPYLKGAVSTVFPEGAKLARDAVPVEDHVARVELESWVVADADNDARARMVEQLRLSMKGVADIDSVQLSVDQQPIEVAATPPNPLQVNPGVDERMVGIEGGGLVSFTLNEGVRPIEGLTKVGTGALSGAAASPTEGYAVLDEFDETLLGLRAGSAPAKLYSGKALAAPSYDVRGSVWTVSTAAVKPQIVAIGNNGNDHPVRRFSPDWLTGLNVTSVRVSVDGSRLAMTTRKGAETNVLVAGISRDGQGRPTGLLPPIRVDAKVPATRVLWTSDTSLLVYSPHETRAVTPEIVTLDGSAGEKLYPLLGLTSIAAAPTADRVIIGQTTESLHVRRGNMWEKIAGNLRDPAYRG